VEIQWDEVEVTHVEKNQCWPDQMASLDSWGLSGICARMS
jgi:hypothetical protein